jgi:hypothetical protein
VPWRCVGAVADPKMTTQKLFPPTLLATPEVRDFCLHKQIMDINFLRYQLRESLLLSIDVEGQERFSAGITSIGLAILPPHAQDVLAAASQALKPPFWTREVVHHFNVESSCIKIEGRSRNRPSPRFSLGKSITTADAGRQIRDIVAGDKQRHACKELVLVGWHPHTLELSCIRTLCPDIFQEFAGWVDVLVVMRRTCVSKQEDLTKNWPSLGDTMRSVGFNENCLPQRRCHSAGDNAIGALGVLVRLLTRDPFAPPIEVQRQRPLKKWLQEKQRVGDTSLDGVLSRIRNMYNELGV